MIAQPQVPTPLSGIIWNKDVAIGSLLIFTFMNRCGILIIHSYIIGAETDSNNSTVLCFQMRSLLG